MAFNSASGIVGTQRVLLFKDQGGGAASKTNVLVQVVDGEAQGIRIGGGDGANNTNWPVSDAGNRTNDPPYNIEPGESLGVETIAGEEIYAIADADTEVRVLVTKA